MRPLGFKAKSDTLFYRLTDKDVLHTVGFELSPIGFTCFVAIQPLYAYDHTVVFHYSFGARLSRFRTLQQEWWNYENTEDGLDEIEKLLIKNGMPWFDEFGSPEGIVRFINKKLGRRYGVNFDDDDIFLGFSYFYLGQIEKGKRCIREYFEGIADDAADFIFTYKNELVDLMNRITADNVHSILADIANANKNILKIC